MGVVYKAVDQKLDRTVALKFLPPDLDSEPRRRELFLREARAASALDHPNIGTIYGIEETAEGGLFIAMAYYEGETLAEKVRRGPLSRSVAVPIAIQMARGLAEAHSHNIVHRDIKPSNTILTKQGLVKIVDFGLARVIQSTSATQSTHISGTALYMSPEQAMCKRIDGRTDLWSLGVVFYQMLMGRSPFVADSVPQLLFNVVNAAPAPMEDIAPELQQIVYRALAKDPADRYQSAQEMLRDLEKLPIADANTPTQSMALEDLQKYMENASQSALSATIPVPEVRRRTRRWMAAPVLLLVLLAVALLIPALRQRLTAALFRTPERHIAVLPFTTIGTDEGNTALADGLMESLTSRLSNLEVGSQSLWVVPAGEVRRLKVTDPGAARKQFGTNLVVTGTVQRDGRAVRLIVNLIDAASTRQLGSGEFQDLTGDFAVVQDSAVTKLANLMNIPLTREMLRGTGGSVMPAAYESYLTGIGFLQRYDKPGNLDRAVESLESAVKTDPKFALGFSGLGEAWLMKYKIDQNTSGIDEALANSQRAVALNDQLAPVYVTLGRIHDSTGKQDLAAQEFQHALELDPRNPDALTGLAAMYERQARYKDAEETFVRASALRPDYWYGHNELGGFYSRRRRFAEAAAQFRKVVELTPDNAAGYINLGNAFSNDGKLPEAAEALQKAMRLAPSYAASANLGVVYYRQQRWADAALNYEQALKLNGKDYRVWINLALADRWLGKDQEAIDAYRRALPLLEETAKLRPQDATVQSGLGLLYAHLGQRDKAISRLDTALALAPEDRSVLDRTAEAYEALGDRGKSIQWMQKTMAAGQTLDNLQHNPEVRAVLNDPNFKPPTMQSTKK